MLGIYYVSFFLFFVTFVNSLITSHPKTLVVTKDDLSKYKYSKFLKSLKRRGHKLDIRTANDKSISISSYGEYHYDNILILTPSSTKLGDLTYKDLLTFIDSGRNILIGLNRNASNELIRKFSDRCGIDIHDKHSKIVDHSNYDEIRGNINHNIILLNNYNSIYYQQNKSNEDVLLPIIYDGIGMSLKNNAHLTLSLLTGKSTTYSMLENNNGGPPEKIIIASGKQLSLISSLQMLNNARITFIGSLKMLTDEFYDTSIYHPSNSINNNNNNNNNKKIYTHSGNEKFLEQISSWAFGECGILKAENITHYKYNKNNNNNKENKEEYMNDDNDKIVINPTRYRIKDDVIFELDIFEYKNNEWIPFTENDVQFEFIRLDPFIRQYMEHDNNGHYKISFKLPDIFGVYKFNINYQRKGWSNLLVEPQAVSVRAFRHDEHPRFLFNAYPYYFASFSMVIGFVLFTIFFLFGAKKQKGKIW